LPGLLEYLQLLFLGAEDFQRGVALGIEFLLLCPTCRLDLIQTFLYPRILLALNLCKAIFEFRFPDGVKETLKNSFVARLSSKILQ